MKRFFGLMLLIALNSAAQASSCQSPAQVRSSYKSCLEFLKFTPAKQKEIAKKTGYGLTQVTNACKLQAKNGLRAMLAAEKEMCRYIRGENNPTESNTSPYQPAAPLCSSSGDCRGGYCGAANVCSNGGTESPCDNSGQCANGYCGGGGFCN